LRKVRVWPAEGSLPQLRG